YHKLMRLRPHNRRNTLRICALRRNPMNKPVSPADLVTPKVTTGGIIGSRKVYSAPDSAPDLRVPIREIVLDPSSGEPPVPVYDPSGPYTDDNMTIDVERGLKRARVEWLREAGGSEEY